MLSFKKSIKLHPTQFIQYQAHLQENRINLLCGTNQPRKRAVSSASAQTTYADRTACFPVCGGSPCFYKNGLSCSGSLTLEAAVVLPVFLIALITVLYIAKIILVQLTFIGPLYETAERLSRDAYLFEEAADENGWKESMAGELLTAALSAGAAKSCFVQLVGKDWIDRAGIDGGVSGVSFFYSRLPDEDDMIDLTVHYQMRVPFSLVSVSAVPVTQRCRIHAWVGYTPETENQVQKVYVTEHGTVYHLYLTCRHLKLSIREVTFLEVERLRNRSGGKYYPCELCGAQHGALVFITDTGNRYHASLSCSGLKRGIRELPIDEVGDLPCCSSCASGG